MTPMTSAAAPRPFFALRSRLVLLAVVLCGVAGLMSACGGSSSTSPSNAVDLTGTWTGTASDSSGNATVTVTLSQTGAAFSGTGRLQSTASTATANVAGTVSGTSLTFTWTIPVGGYSAPFQTCSSASTGSATVTSNRFVGSYSGSYGGSGACTGPISNGLVTLTRQ